jgi:O-antigen/teichoic acid export membrane protein
LTAEPSAPARRGVIRLFRAAVFVRVLRALRGIVLARLLAPDVFGSYAVIGALVAPLASLTNVGLTAVVAREAAPSERLLAAAAWLNRTTALAAAALLVAAVSVWSIAGGHPGLLAPGIVVALAMAVYVVPQVDLGILQGRRRFEDLARVDVTFDAVWTAAAIALAVATRSVWALAAAELLAQASRAVLTRRLVGHRPPASREAVRGSHVGRFAAASILGGVLWSAVYAAPAWMLQLRADLGTIGTFSLAYGYSQLVALTLGGVAGRVALPALGGKEPAARVGHAWQYSEALSLALAPATAVLAVAGPPLLVVATGPGWTVSGEVLSILVWGMAARVVFPFGVLSQAAGRPGLDNFTAATALIAYAALAVLGWSDAVRAAWYVAGVDVVLALAAAALAPRLFGGRFAGRAALAVWIAAAAAAGLATAVPCPGGPIACALARTGVCVLVFVAGAALVPRVRSRYTMEARAAIATARAALTP